MLVIYASNTGYTEQYAKMLAKALDTYAYSIDRLPECHKGEECIYLGWLMAGGIVGYKKAKKLMKVRAVAGVGMGPDNPALVPGFRAKMGIKDKVAVFYLQGGFDLARLKGPYKLIMALKVKEIAGRLAAKPDRTTEEELTFAMTHGPASAVCQENLAPIIAWAENA